jgi:oxygen-independent coproporphyrinogen-3 oxidase
MVQTNTDRIHSLYVHVPFCAQKCGYCAFYSEAAGGELINRYVAALVRELEMVAGDLQPRTVFFGGGTPSLLNLRQWEHLFKTMERARLLGAAEFTVECNPATVSADKAKVLRDYGVNRVSLGVQSLDEDLLGRLGRVHSRAMVFKSYDLLRQAGFDNVNLDLMFAIPTQTMAVWRDTLNEAMAMQSEHLSSYEVIYEDDTPLFTQLKAGRFAVDENLACDMYGELTACAVRAGFEPYEIANFARRQRAGDPAAPARPPEDPLAGIPGLACRHNVNYWRGGSFYGLGPSATGYVGGVRTKNWANTPLYCEQLEQGRRAFESSEELPPLRRAGETAAFGLRMNAGWPFAEFERVTGFDLRREWAADMAQLEERGWAVREDRRFRLTPAGLRFADAAAELFLR